jgi:glycosyltransferase involved in cell wall biosynthesis
VVELAGTGPLEADIHRAIAAGLPISHLGLVTFEAYDQAKPVLAAASGGLQETVLPGITGWLHTPGDPDSLVCDILSCEASNRQTIGIAGRTWLLRETSITAWQKAFTHILHAATAA